MVIGNLVSYSALGLGDVRPRSTNSSERNNAVLEAKLDPSKPNEYSVQLPAPVIAPPEKISDTKNTSRRYLQNTDQVSRTFNAIADYAPKVHKIDVYV